MSATHTSSEPPTDTSRWLGPIYFSRPTADHVALRVQSVRDAPFDYPHVGASANDMPEGWHHDEATAVVGHGEETWKAAKAALRNWTQFDLEWVWPHDRTAPLQVGAPFAFTSRQLGMWSVNVCRIAYVIDEEDTRFGFGYGTVGSHVVRGEELFLLHRDEQGAVHFTIRKFSLPAHPLVRVGLPFARRAQRRFSIDALARIVEESS